MAGGNERILRRRIKSVQSTKKITKAMELIAASRIVKAQQRVAAARPYSEQITEVIRNLAAAGAGARLAAAPAARGRSTPSAFVVVAGDRGLCRWLQHQRHPRRRAGHGRRRGPRASRPRLVTVGKKATGYFRFRGYEIDDGFIGLLRRARPTRTPAGSPTRSSRRFEAGEYDQVELVYTQFLSAGVQQVLQRRFVPLETDVLDDGPTRRRPVGRLRVRARARTRSSTACCPATPRPASSPPCSRARRPFFAAQQRAMKSATDNAEELITKLSRGDEPGPPGRHHHRDHGDRRRRRGPARRAVRRTTTSWPTTSSPSATSSTPDAHAHPEPTTH